MRRKIKDNREEAIAMFNDAKRRYDESMGYLVSIQQGSLTPMLSCFLVNGALCHFVGRNKNWIGQSISGEYMFVFEAKKMLNDLADKMMFKCCICGTDIFRSRFFPEDDFRGSFALCSSSCRSMKSRRDKKNAKKDQQEKTEAF